MRVEISQVRQLIESAFSKEVQVLAQSADNVHFEVIVVSQEFEGVNRVKRQQKVYQNLRTHIESGALHAIALKTYTPQEWADCEHRKTAD